MINSDVASLSYLIQRGVVTYPISFKFHFNENNSPQLLIKIGDDIATINVDYTLADDNLSLTLIPTEIEAAGLTGPDDYSWMDRIVGKELLVQRNIPFIQPSDYTVGRISPEQIEYDLDASVMRDQQLAQDLESFTVDVALAESLAHAAVQTANDAVESANNAIDSANNANETANSAVVTANEAKSTAEQASQDAVDAMADAASAVNKASSADLAASQALELAATAVTTAQNAENTVSRYDDRFTTVEASVDANADAIQKTRSDYIQADSEIHQILNNHADELTALHNDVDAIGDQVSGIEEKIPESASGSNPLITKQQVDDNLSGYLPLSGGELAGPLSTVDNLDVVCGTHGHTHRFAPYKFDSRDFVLSYKAAESNYFTDRYMFTSSCIRPVSDDAVKDLGSSGRRWRRVYATIISNGADLIVPTEGGTLARLEDLEGIGGGGDYATVEYVDTEVAAVLDYASDVDTRLSNANRNITQLNTNLNTVAEWVRGPKDDDGNRAELETEAQNAYSAINELNAKIGDINTILDNINGEVI